MRYTKEYCKENNIVVHCSSQELWDMCKETCGDSWTLDKNYWVEGDDCFKFYKGSSLTVSELEWYKNQGDIIISAEIFLQDNGISVNYEIY